RIYVGVLLLCYCLCCVFFFCFVFFFFSSRRRHTRCYRDWSSDVCSSDLAAGSSVTISGTGFGSSQSSGSVDFNGTAAAVQSWSDAQIVAFVPSGAASGRSEERRVGKECRCRWARDVSKRERKCG